MYRISVPVNCVHTFIEDNIDSFNTDYGTVVHATDKKIWAFIFYEEMRIAELNYNFYNSHSPIESEINRLAFMLHIITNPKFAFIRNHNYNSKLNNQK